jgi:hypothetical protein
METSVSVVNNWTSTVHDVQPYSSEDFNVTHHINSLSFGTSLKGKDNPLDGFLTIADKGRIYLYLISQMGKIV